MEPQDQPHLDASAWSELLEGTNPPAILVLVSSWMGERLKQHVTAEDILQEALAMAWRDRASHRWRGPRAFRSWLLGIARNRVHDHADRVSARKRGAGVSPRPLAVGGGMDTASGFLPGTTTTPSRIASLRERAAAMDEVLRSLPGDLAEVLRLRLFEQLPMREVAQRTGIGLSTAKERFLKAAELYRSRLRTRLSSTSIRPRESR